MTSSSEPSPPIELLLLWLALMLSSGVSSLACSLGFHNSGNLKLVSLPISLPHGRFGTNPHVYPFASFRYASGRSESGFALCTYDCVEEIELLAILKAVVIVLKVGVLSVPVATSQFRLIGRRNQSLTLTK